MTVTVVHDNSLAELLSQSFMPRLDVSTAFNLYQTPVDAGLASICFLSAVGVSPSSVLRWRQVGQVASHADTQREHTSPQKWPRWHWMRDPSTLTLCSHTTTHQQLESQPQRQSNCRPALCLPPSNFSSATAGFHTLISAPRRSSRKERNCTKPLTKGSGGGDGARLKL